MIHAEIAQVIKADDARITLAYAFNSVGKTRLCVAYKDATKQEDGSHTGVYYNAFSEDLFVWDNDEDNGGANIRLTVRPSSLSKFHALLTEDNVRDSLKAYKPTFAFAFNLHKDDPSRGIDSITFFVPSQNPDDPKVPIKISRGEERTFIWCFFLALFEVDGWADKQSSHFFIDDPVSSLDDRNIFITASTIFDLIEKYYDKRKIIITTHHIGLFAILTDWLTKGEKAERYRKITKRFILSDSSGDLRLENCRQEVLLYHLRLLQVLAKAQATNDVRAYHLALLRQVLENVASFLGVGQFKYVLEQIGIEDAAEAANIINILSHKKVYYFESDLLIPDSKAMFENVLKRLKEKYNFVLHA